MGLAGLSSATLGLKQCTASCGCADMHGKAAALSSFEACTAWSKMEAKSVLVPPQEIAHIAAHQGGQAEASARCTAHLAALVSWKRLRGSCDRAAYEKEQGALHCA